MSSTVSKRLFTLDAMRGIAAIVVVLHHQKAIHTPGGYLAVDFFFALSGLVIAQAYEKRLLAGLSVGSFMLQRIVRLYPMLAIGLAFGGVRALQMMFSAQDTHAVLQFIVNAGANGLILPSPMSAKELFPLDLPAWSLFFELVINAFYAIVLVRLPTKVLVGVLVVAGAALLASTAYYRSFDGGYDWVNIGQGFTRVAWAFTAGVLLQRLGWARIRILTPWCVLPALVLVACMVMPLPMAIRPCADLFFAMLVTPVLIIWAAGWQAPNGQFRVVSEALGDLSYPLYAIHYPVLQLWAHVVAALHLSPFVSLAIYLPAICGVSLLLARTVDLGIRKRASRLWRPQPAS